MQRLLRMLFLASALLLATFHTTTCFSQASTTAFAAATIVTPGTVSKESDFHVTFSKPALKSPGTSKGSNHNHSSQSKPKVSAAALAISGYPNYVYGVTVPGVITVSTGNSTISVTPLLTSTSGNFILSSQGTDKIHIGSSVNVCSANTLTAATMPKDLEVTIVYN